MVNNLKESANQVDHYNEEVYSQAPKTPIKPLEDTSTVSDPETERKKI